MSFINDKLYFQKEKGIKNVENSCKPTIFKYYFQQSIVNVFVYLFEFELYDFSNAFNMFLVPTLFETSLI